MTQPRKEQLNILRAVWTVTTVTVTGNNTFTVLPGSFVSSSVTQIPGGSISNPPVRGIVTTDVGGGFVKIRQTINALSLDFNGAQIFGRLTFFGGFYILHYKVISNSVETTATIPAGSYSIQLMYSEVMNFGEIPVTSDVIYGYSQELLPSGGDIPGDLTVGGNTVLGTNSSNTLSINSSLDTNFIPTPDNTVSLGNSTFRFSNTNTTSLAARADNIDLVKSVLTANSLLASNTTFAVDGSNSISVGASTATAVNLGRASITTTINGMMNATGFATIGNNLTVNGSSSTFNGDLSVTGTLSANNLLLPNLSVSDNSTFGTNLSNTVDFLASFVSSLIPQVSDTYDIGSITNYWRNIHSTRLFTHYDTVDSSYSFLEPNNLFSSVDFDIDGYGALFVGISYATQLRLGNFVGATSIDGYDVIAAISDKFSIKNQSGTKTYLSIDTTPQLILDLPKVNFAADVVAPEIIQPQAAASAGQNLLIQAQQGANTFGYSTNNTGGALFLAAGDSGYNNFDGYDGYPGAAFLMTGKAYNPQFSMGAGFKIDSNLAWGVLAAPELPMGSPISGCFLIPVINETPLIGPNSVGNSGGTLGYFFGFDLIRSRLGIGASQIVFDGYVSNTLHNNSATIIQDTFTFSNNNPQPGHNMTVQAQSGQPNTSSDISGGHLFLSPGFGTGPTGGQNGNVFLGPTPNGLNLALGGGAGIICWPTAQIVPTSSISNVTQLYTDPNDGHVKILKPNGSVLDLG